MSNLSRRSNSWDADAPNYFATPAALLGLWNPFLIGLAQLNGQAGEGFGTLLSEWQNFVGRRLAEDMKFMQQLATCKSPDQIAAAYADFWQKGFADHTKEFATLNNLITGISHKAIFNAQSASGEAAKTGSPLHAPA
jgi:phasin protein